MYILNFPQKEMLKPEGFSVISKLDSLIEYIKLHSEITNILITGGDPMVMKA